MGDISTAHREVLNALYQLRLIRDYGQFQQVSQTLDRPGEKAIVVWMKEDAS